MVKIYVRFRQSFAYFGVPVAPPAFVQMDHVLDSKAAALVGLAILAVLTGAALLMTPNPYTTRRTSH